MNTIAHMSDILCIAESVTQPEWRKELIKLCKLHIHKLANVYTNNEQVYPEKHTIFEAFNHADLTDLKVIIIGQDPYINGEANGLAFSVSGGRLPPSLRNIFKEIEFEYGLKRTDPNLRDWAKQGCLLLNRTLTVLQSKSNSHSQHWLPFTEDLIRAINDKTNNVVFMLWGSFAQQCEKYIDNKKHLILKHSHPSPLARKPFVGNGHFQKANEYLESHGKAPLVWV